MESQGNTGSLWHTCTSLILEINEASLGSCFTHNHLLFSWKDWQRCGFNFHTVFHILRPWNKSYCVCIRCTVVFISAYHTDVFREDADVCIIKVKRAGTLRSVLLRQNQIYYLLYCTISATRTEKTNENPWPCFEEQVLGCYVIPKQMF